MDAAQMLTAQEIARQCEQLARLAQQHEHAGHPAPAADRGPHATGDRHLRLADPITEPIPRIVEPRRPDPEPPQPVTPDDLTERESGILAFERQWWKRSGAKEQAIRELFDMSASRYYQVLNALADKPAAFRVDPMLIKRLRKVRASRKRVRAARRLGIELH